MIKEKIKKEKGISMISLVITILIMLILTNVLIYKSKDNIEIEKLTNLYNDIDLLRDKISEYYEEYGKIPAKTKYTAIDNLANIISKKNDTGDFYVIDLEAMQGITINYGKDYEIIKNNENNVNDYKDIYIINENSHNIFYVKGINVEEDGILNTYYTDYTEPDETTVNLKYIDGILIPEGYYYIGTHKDNSGNENIVISSNKDEEINTTSKTQYIWQKQISPLETIPDTISLTVEQNKDDFLKSVNIYKGYFKNKNKTLNVDVIYLTVKENKWSEIYTKNEKYIDKNGDTAYIPTGFRVSLAEGTNEIRNGLVITDKIDEEGNSVGNEFVWIPVDNYEEFIREDMGTTPIQEENFINTEPTLDKYYEPSSVGKEIDETAKQNIQEVQKIYKSVRLYKGFYIGRYETGIEVDTPRTNTSGITQEPVIKKNKYIYNYIKWGNSLTDETAGAVEKARSMYENSTLCYGVQWDAIMRWISQDTTINYVLEESLEKGNYDKDGNLIKTGTNETYQIKNIYDIVGNVAEWTMETYGLEEKVARGGKSGGTNSITSRETNPIDTNSGLIGFRVALYIETESGH